jgi:hypothetical protein
MLSKFCGSWPETHKGQSSSVVQLFWWYYFLFVQQSYWGPIFQNSCVTYFPDYKFPLSHRPTKPFPINLRNLWKTFIYFRHRRLPSLRFPLLRSYGVCDRLINEYWTLLERYWQSKTKFCVKNLLRYLPSTYPRRIVWFRAQFQDLRVRRVRSSAVWRP